jgi:hypothetical protein
MKKNGHSRSKHSAAWISFSLNQQYICFANTSFNGYELINCWMLWHVFPRRYKNSYPSQVKYLCLPKHPSTIHYKPRLKTDRATHFTLTLSFPLLPVFHKVCSSKMLIFLISLSLYQLTVLILKLK